MVTTIYGPGNTILCQGTELIVWNVTILICICTFQVLWPIFAILWILLTPLMLVCWLGVGLVIHETHGMCVGSVRIFWVGIWTGTNTNAHINTHKPAGRYGSFVPKETVEIVKPVVAVEAAKTVDIVDIDTYILNRSMYWGFLLDTVPLLCVQLINNYRSNGNAGIEHWTPFQLVSSILSIYGSLAGVWKYVYWYYVRHVAWCDIPISMAQWKYSHIPPKMGVYWVSNRVKVAPAPDIITNGHTDSGLKLKLKLSNLDTSSGFGTPDVDSMAVTSQMTPQAQQQPQSQQYMSNEEYLLINQDIAL